MLRTLAAPTSEKRPKRKPKRVFACVASLLIMRSRLDK